ncbi:MAG TPA: ATP-binding protein [Candidatus Omnitrophota bacterium]|nr:ATP-binding protein [Candidatus Omnitrophota bacterium]HPS36708.1 ATP-binding protein [Candidatus Omnitrophota bacterium]
MTNSIFNPQIYFFNVYALPHFMVGVLISLEGLFVYFQSKRAVTHIGYMITTVTAGIWLTGVGIVCSMSDEATAVVFSRVYTWFGIIFVTPALFFFSASWDPEILRKNKKWIWVHYLIAVGFYLLCVLSPGIVGGVYGYRAGYFPKAGPLEPLFLVWFFGLMILSSVNFIRIYRAASTAAVKKNIRLMFLAFVVSFVGSVEYLPNYGIPVFPVAFFPMFLFTTIIGYCVIRYRLMDIETVIHKTFMWFVTTAVAMVPFGALVYWSQRLRDPGSAWSSTVYFLAVAIIFYFYYRSIQPRLDQLFQRQRVNLLAVLDQFSKELVHLKNLRDLLQSFARMLRRRLYVRRLSVYLLDEENAEFVPSIAKGVRNLKPFPQSHPFLAWLERQDAVVAAELVVGDPQVEAFRDEIRDYFEKTQALVAVPFVLGGKLIGVAHLGRKANLRRYGFREIQFFSQLRSPVTIAFSNSMRFEDIRELSEELKRWNVELEERVEERTRELVKTQEQLVQAEKLATLGTLAGGVAHEINNPLTAVLTNAQILKMTADQDTKESLDLIEEGAKRCQGIVQKLMKYARKTAEEAPHRPVDLNEVVKGTCALLRFQFHQENIEVEMQLGAVPPVPGIANELEQVLTNLLVNARDAVKANSQSKDSKVNWPSPGNLESEKDRSQGRGAKGKIVVETRSVEESVELIVRDNGIGISKENQKKIFDPFFTTKDVGAGTGLGLAVSYGILKRHSATIAVESAPGKGATFTIRFPLPQL